MKFLRDDSGQALPIAVLCATVLFAALALSVDIGLLFRVKRNMQVAADSAAAAAALDYLYNQSVTSAQAAGRAASSLNGVNDGVSGASVTINIPPASGPNQSAGNAEAIVSRPSPTYFLSMFNHSNVAVAARAVAGTPGANSACIWLMNPSGAGLNLQGSYDVEAPGCGIYVNSNTSDALSVTGGGGTVNAAFLDVVGNSNLQHLTSPTSPTMNAAARRDPWGNLTGPTATNGQCTTTDTTTKTITGTISGPELNKSICYTQAVTLSGATMGAGTYAFLNGVTISGTVTVNSGTLDIAGGSFNQPSNSIVNVTSPRSGTYNGIAIMQPAANTNQLQVQFGSNNQTLDGYIYAPGAQVYLQDNGGGVTSTGIVAHDLKNKSSKLTISSYDLKHPTTTVNRVVTVME